ncbi:hypothetical protein Bca101_032051 [Brassica carinata]
MLVVLPSGYYPEALWGRSVFLLRSPPKSLSLQLGFGRYRRRVSDLSGVLGGFVRLWWLVPWISPRRRGLALSSRSRELRCFFRSEAGLGTYLARTFTSDTFSTVLILALLCFGECLSLVLSRVSLLGFSPLTPEKAPHRFGYFSLVLKEIESETFQLGVEVARLRMAILQYSNSSLSPSCASCIEKVISRGVHRN